MDQDEKVFEPTATEIEAEELEGKRGPILATLSARITVRYPVERTEEQEEAAKEIDLTNAVIASVVRIAIEQHIDWSLDAPDHGFTVNATAEKV